MVSQGHQEQEPYRAMIERRHEDIPVDVSLISPDVPAEPRGIFGASKVGMGFLAYAYILGK